MKISWVFAWYPSKTIWGPSKNFKALCFILIFPCCMNNDHLIPVKECSSSPYNLVCFPATVAILLFIFTSMVRSHVHMIDWTWKYKKKMEQLILLSSKSTSSLMRYLSFTWFIVFSSSRLLFSQASQIHLSSLNFKCHSCIFFCVFSIYSSLFYL